MKKIMMSSIIGLACFAMPIESQAINKEWSAVAGFVGGLLVADAFNDSRVEHRTVYHDYGYQNNNCYQPRGYWKTVHDRRWVNGRRDYYYDHCGRRQYTWTPGYWTTYTRQIWVSYD